MMLGQKCMEELQYSIVPSVGPDELGSFMSALLLIV